MAKINTYRYLQAIFIGIPMGIYSLFYGVGLLHDIEQDVNDYSSSHGIVNSIHIDYIYATLQSKYSSNALVVEIDEDVFYVVFGEYRNAIKQRLFVNDTVTIWYYVEDTGNKAIKAIKKDDSFIIEYEPGGYFVGILVIIWGLFWTIISGLYVVKHPEDLLGGKEVPNEDS